MVELKTITDISVGVGRLEKQHRAYYKRILRKEVIGQIKELKIGDHVDMNNLHNFDEEEGYDNGAILWIKWFFGITEKDLE